MPRGFAGSAATAYLGKASDAHKQAIAAGRKVPPSIPMGPRERSLPFGPEDAKTGTFTTGRGDSSNVVVSQGEYEIICNMVSQVDDRVGECLYNVAMEIEAMCQTSFVLPTAVPRCLNISDDVKRSLGQFRSLTEDAVMQARRFAREITEIG